MVSSNKWLSSLENNYHIMIFLDNDCDHVFIDELMMRIIILWSSKCNGGIHWTWLISFHFCHVLSVNKNMSEVDKHSSLTLVWRSRQSGVLWICSSHRTVFFRELMPPTSNSATHWPISGQCVFIPSSSQELFFLALFGSQPAEQRAQDQQRRKTSLL